MKTKVHAEDGKQDLVITREFNLPLDLLFKAYTDPAIVSQWMGTNVLKLENKKHGSWQFETTNASGDVVFKAGGVYHEFVQNRKIIRTFEMENAPFEVQLEFLEFESISSESSKLRMHIIFRSLDDRNNLLKLPFAQGLNQAHNRLQQIVGKINFN